MYACLSALFAGILGTLQKVSIQRGLSTVLVNSYSSLVSAITALLLFAYLGEIRQGPLLGFVLVFISGGIYMYGTISRTRSMRFLDTSVVFPTYKSMTLLGTVLGGVFFFTDHLSPLAWIGIILTIGAPFLLVEIHERHARKKQPMLAHFRNAGWLLLYVSVCAGVVSALLNKFTVNFIGPMLLFTAASHLFGGLTGLAQQFKTHLGDWKKQFLDIRHPHSHLLVFSVLGGICQCASFYCLLTALSLGQISTTFAINSMYLLFPVLFSLWYYHERLTFKRGLALILSIVAIFLLK